MQAKGRLVLLQGCRLLGIPDDSPTLEKDVSRCGLVPMVQCVPFSMGGQTPLPSPDVG